MRQFLLTMIAVLVGGFLALLAYDRFVVAPREAAQSRATVAEAAQGQARVDLQAARAEAKQVASEVEASVQRSVESAKSAMNEQAKEMDKRALLAEAVSRATMFKVAMTEYYQTNGQWPQDADEAGLPSPEEMRGGAVDGIGFDRSGVIRVSLRDPYPGSAILLEPKVGASGMVEWRCAVKGDAAIRSVLTRCEMR